MEDQEVSRAAIVQEFGEDVASLVMEVTDEDKRLPHQERKRLQVLHARAVTAGGIAEAGGQDEQTLTALAISSPANW